MSMTPAPLYIDGEAAAHLLDPASVLRVVERALVELAEKRLVNGVKGGFSLDDGNGCRHMGAISGCDVAANMVGVKWFAAVDANSRRGLPRVPATILLCDAITGLLTGVIDATSLTAVRTAALAIAAIRPCVGTRLRKATIVGFGPIGQAVARYLPQQFDVGEIVVASRGGAAHKTAPSLTVESRLDRAITDADLVVTATGLSANTPLVDAAWLKPGATVCALGSYQEIDGRIVAGADRIFVDNWEACRQRGNLAPVIQSGALARSAVTGAFADLVAGKLAARASADQTVLLVSVGIGALDIALGAELLKQARIQGVGQPLG
ncbi:MAG TPA: hypothetical protein VK681_23570 [Reyranella sp.]|nr:hypothetical protein [Reyranella sp.]